jgi:hypothetical protein
MSTPSGSRPHPDYGLDAPPIIRNLLVVGCTVLTAALVLPFLGVSYPAGIPLREIGLPAGLSFCLGAGVMVYYSKVGKLRARERFLAAWSR